MVNDVINCIQKSNIRSENIYGEEEKDVTEKF